MTRAYLYPNGYWFDCPDCGERNITDRDYDVTCKKCERTFKTHKVE